MSSEALAKEGVITVPSWSFGWQATRMRYVYIIRSSIFPDQIYKGSTCNLKDRLQRHNRGEVSYTSKYRPWKIVFYAAFNDEARANKFEQYLKTGSGVAFLRKHLI